MEFLSRLDWDPVGSRYNQDNIFHIRTSSWDEKRPTLLKCFFQRRTCLSNILKEQPNRATGKKIPSKHRNLLKRLYINSQKQTKKCNYVCIYLCMYVSMYVCMYVCMYACNIIFISAFFPYFVVY